MKLGASMVHRRDFLRAGATILPLWTTGGRAGAATNHGGVVAIHLAAPDGIKSRLAISELGSGILALGLAGEVVRVDGSTGAKGQALFVLAIDTGRLGADQYEISRAGDSTILRAGSEQALLYAVYELLERQGAIFGIDGPLVPIDQPRRWVLPATGETWRASPLLATRGLLPWPDFLNCISVYNKEDFRAYFASMLRMRLNMFGMHVYTDTEQPTEAYLSVRFAGAGQQAELETSAMQGWGYLPQRTSTFGMGSSAYYDRETFGSDAARLAADNWAIADRTRDLLRDSLGFARDLGIRTGVGFEPYKLPAAIGEALPPEAKAFPAGFAESPTAKRLLETRLADLLERYPMIDHVWLWEDETSNWQSRAKNVPISTTAFEQAYAFLKRHAPEKRLVVAGWGGFTRHFSHLHQRLPGDVIFSALSNSLGWDPVADAFGALEGRERWPIPWLEDDPSMWFPQFRASHVENDLKRARSLGCQGMLGIHWRHRIVDPTATFFARASWNGALTTKAHYHQFARTQASGARAEALGALLDDCDEGHAIASTFTGRRDANGFAVHVELTADYQQGFKYQENEPDPVVMATQARTAARFAALARQAGSALERERLGYLSGFVNFMVPYCEAYRQAHALDAVLAKATSQRKAGDADAARALVLREGVPLWTGLLPNVRSAILAFQSVVATRNDLGQLSSMQNKLVRIAVERLRLSLEEFVGDLPDGAQEAYRAALAPDTAMPRLFLPTRPTILRPGEPLRLYIVAPGLPEDAMIALRSRPMQGGGWSTVAAVHEGRSVFSVSLEAPAGIDAMTYRVEARGSGGLIADPPGDGVYRATVLA